ncbi:unnamed protein product, partial [Symbiodinium sp. KB8]
MSGGDGEKTRSCIIEVQPDNGGRLGPPHVSAETALASCSPVQTPRSRITRLTVIVVLSYLWESCVFQTTTHECSRGMD